MNNSSETVFDYGSRFFPKIALAVRHLVVNLQEPSGPRVTILYGPTGTGKSVWTSVVLAALLKGRTVVTQPRTITLKADADSGSLPGFVKHILNELSLQGEKLIGVSFRGSKDRVLHSNKLKFVTDGRLIRWILNGRIKDYDVVVIDEAHEESLNMAILFSLLKSALRMYPDLKLVIASATLETRRFVDYFENPDIGEVFIAKPWESKPGTNFPIEERWPASESTYIARDVNDIPRAVKERVGELIQSESVTTDILVFVPTVKVLYQVISCLTELELQGVSILPCHAQLDVEELAAFNKAEALISVMLETNQSPGFRRVIVATNYAETSVTLSNLGYVIDSGFSVFVRWSPYLESKVIEVRHHTVAGCIQRKGRLGRTQRGVYLPLFTKEDFQNSELFAPYPVPQIVVSPLCKVLLTLLSVEDKSLGDLDLMGFDPEEEDQEAEFERATDYLRSFSLIDDSGKLTALGREVERVEAETCREALLLYCAEQFDLVQEVAVFLAFTRVPRKVFEENEEGFMSLATWANDCKDDLDLYVRLIFHVSFLHSNEERSAWMHANHINPVSLEAVLQERDSILKQFFRSSAMLNFENLGAVRALLAWVSLNSEFTGNGSNGFFKRFREVDFHCIDKLLLESDSVFADFSGASSVIVWNARSDGGQAIGKHLVLANTEWCSAKDKKLSDIIGVLESDYGEYRSKGNLLSEEPIPLEPNLVISVGVQYSLLLQLASGNYAVGRNTKDPTERFLVNIKDLDALDKGEVFDAEFLQPDASAQFIPVSQEGLRASAFPCDSTAKAVIRNILKRNGKLQVVFFRLPNGFRGIMHAEEARNLELELGRDLECGTKVEVVIDGNKKKRLRLGLPKAHFSEGAKVDGIVYDFSFLPLSANVADVWVRLAPFTFGKIESQGFRGGELDDVVDNTHLKVKVVGYDHQSLMYQLTLP